MASILRSGKFIRCFAGLTRNVVVNTVRDTESSNLFQNAPTCMCTQFQQGFSSSAQPKHDLNLDRQLRRLDQDVRRIGRISRRDIEEVLDEIRTQRSATSSQSLLVIRCCGNLVPEELPEVRTAMVQEIWRTLHALNVPMDISHYNALLRVYLENEHTFSPTDFLAELEAKNIEPNRVTYQRLIERYCQQGDIDGATRILEFMRAKNLPVNESVFNSLILGHSQANDMESAKGILTVMKQANLEPSADTYATLLCCYARHGDLESIESTLAVCEKEDIILLDKDLLDIVYQLAINGHTTKIEGVLNRLRFGAGFNQDAVNIILRLVNKGHEDVGFNILRLMPRGIRADGQQVDVGTFFIRQLVKVNRPMEKILSICKQLQDEGLNPKALLIATEAGLTNGSVNNALPLLKEMKNAGLPIRQHYFWPLMCSAESNQVIDIIRRMQDEFALNPNSETVRDYVIPNLREKNWEKIVTILRDAGISHATAASSAAYTALSTNQMKEALQIMQNCRAFYPLPLFKSPLISALAKTEDYNSFISIMRQIYDGQLARTASQQKSENSEADANAEADLVEGETGYDVVGSILYDTTVYFRNNVVATLEKLLPLVVAQGLTVSNRFAERIIERVGAELTPEIADNLGKLSSGELVPVTLPNAPSRKRSPDSLTIEELERFITNVEAKGENSNNLKRHLLNACFRSQKLEKTLEVISKLEAEKYNIPTGVWAQLIDLYTHHGKIAEAMALIEKMKTNDASFALDNMKTVRLVDALIKEERFDEAVKMLEANKKPEAFKAADGSFNYVMQMWRLLNSLAEKGNVQHLQRIFDALMENNYALPTNVLLGSLIKVHLVNDDIPKAMEAFERISEKYKSTPWKNELACRLIQKEDATNLQKLTDLSTNIHGEVNSLYDLVFSFVECGRIRQARKILETPGLRTRPYRIDNACERYKNEGMIQPLEGLIEATKDLSHIDRNKIYFNLLQSYEKNDDAEKAFGLWTKMQEESITPTDEFLTKLADMLKKKKMPVPFVVTNMEEPTNKNKKKAKNVEKSQAGNDVTAMAATAAAAASAGASKAIGASAKRLKTTNESSSQPESLTNMVLMRRSINAGDVDAAISYKNKLAAEEVPNVVDMSRLIEHLVRSERLSEASKYVDELLQQSRFPTPKIFKFYLNKIAASGDIETMQSIGDKINDEQKRLVSFDNRFCNAVIVAGKVEQYFKRLYDEITAAKTPEEAAMLGNKFPRGGAIGILEKHPEMLPEYEKMAEKYAELKQLGPMNVLWMHLISIGNETASKEIWDKHLSNAPRLMFQRVLQTARDHKNEKLAENVITQLRNSKISEGAIGNAYSCLIDIHTNNSNADRALDTLHTAIKDVSLEHINRTALLRLKTALAEQNKEFPYSIPEKRGKNSSSSQSSSDDDVTPQRPETRPPRPMNTAA